MQFPLWFACMVNESMPWHNQVKEGEMYWDNEMVPPTLSLFISFILGIPVVNDIKA